MISQQFPCACVNDKMENAMRKCREQHETQTRYDETAGRGKKMRDGHAGQRGGGAVEGEQGGREKGWSV